VLRTFGLLALATLLASACQPGQPAPAQEAPRVTADTSGIPPGYGRLRQDDIALRLQQHGVAVRLLPLDEFVLRVLSPDSYVALRDLRESRRPALDAIARRLGQVRPSLWYVSFHNQEQGDARFTPGSLLVTSAGRDFRPLDVVPLTAGFGAQRLAQRESQSAILVLDEALQVTQPLVVAYEGTSTAEWADRLQRIERERALIRSRLRQP
jgi:hypothetical protein